MRKSRATLDFFQLTLRCPYLPPATKLGQGYVFTRVCDSIQGGGVVSQHALQVSRPTSRGKLSGLARGSPGPHPMGKLSGLAWGGLQAHTQGGVSEHTLRQTTRQLLLRAVRILLEYILLVVVNL